MSLETKTDKARVEKLKGELLSVLQSPPNAMLAYTLEKKIGGDYTSHEYQAATTQLQEEKRIMCVNGWWAKGRIPVSDAKITTGSDDLDWHLGIGRYGQ